MNVPRFFLVVMVFVLISRLAFGGESFSFKGDVDFSEHSFNILLDFDEDRSLAAAAQRTSETAYHVSMSVRHLKTPHFDLSSEIESSVEVIGRAGLPPETPGEGFLRGEVWSRYTLLDYKPVKELSGGFEIRDHRLYLAALSFGNLKCSGFIGLVPPYKLDLVFHLFEIEMEDFLDFWGVGKKYESSGLVSGEIRSYGTFDRLVLKGSLESRHGFVHKLDYDIISLNVGGVYPDMSITNSMISKADGVSFTLGGPFNLKDKENFKKQIKALTIAPLVSDSRSEWTIKRLNPGVSGTTELKYRFRKGDALGNGAPADEKIDMLGVERTKKF
jgi:hypothetical protein